MSAKEEKAIKRLGISVHISQGPARKEARFPITEQKMPLKVLVALAGAERKPGVGS